MSQGADPVSTTKGSNTTGAGFAGVGGGTTLAVIANNLPEDNPLKSYLLLASPLATILITTFWVWMYTSINNALRDRQADSLLNKAKNRLSEALNDPNISEKHRAELRENLEELNRIAVKRDKERYSSIQIFTEKEYPGNK